MQLVLLLAAPGGAALLLPQSPAAPQAAGRARAPALVLLPAAEDDLGPTEALYRWGGRAAMASWAACAVASLATYKPHRVVHNTIGVAQALSALPLLHAHSSVLAAAAAGGLSRLRPSPARRLNLALAVACAWSAITIVWAPLFTAACVRTVDPVVYPRPLACVAAASHLLLGAVALRSWAMAAPPPPTPAEAAAADTSRLRYTAIVLDEPAPRRAAPPPPPSPPPSLAPPPPPVRAAPYRLLACAFYAFSGLACLSPFPLATVPSLLGKRLARAFGAWTLLAAAQLDALGALGEGAAGRALGAPLRRGLRRMAAAHLVVAAARPLLEEAALYPAALACLPQVAASLGAYAALLWALRGRASEP